MVNNFNNHQIDDDFLDQNCNFISCFLEPFIVTFGLISNIIFFFILFKDNAKKSFNCQKPLRILLMGMLLGDINYLLASLNTYVVHLLKLPDLTTLDVVCQLSSYISNYLLVLRECLMITADYILILLLYTPSESSNNLDIYSRFLTQDNVTDQSRSRRLIFFEIF